MLRRPPALLLASLGLTAVLLLGGRRLRVAGWSMYPLLRHGELVLAESLSYRLRRPRRGEVVLARAGGRLYLKRVVAVPGDVVAVAGGRVWVNGEPLPHTGAQGPAPPGRALGADDYFLLSESPDLGTDSRHLGPVRRGDVLARARLALSPGRRPRWLP